MIHLVPMTPEHHGYIWKKLVSDPLWMATEDYKKTDAANRISLWQVSAKFICQVAMNDEKPLGFYVLESEVWEVGSGTYRYLLEQWHSDHTDASRLLWYDLVKRVKNDPKGLRGLYGFVLEGNTTMEALFKAKGFQIERTQVWKEF